VRSVRRRSRTPTVWRRIFYSFTDGCIASVYKSLPEAEQARFDPMIFDQGRARVRGWEKANTSRPRS